jgi:hypothetical protein
MIEYVDEWVTNSVSIAYAAIRALYESVALVLNSLVRPCESLGAGQVGAVHAAIVPVTLTDVVWGARTVPATQVRTCGLSNGNDDGDILQNVPNSFRHDECRWGKIK